MRQFNQGDRVLAKGKPGTVAYRRMKPPTYGIVEVYSVVLDDRRRDLKYTGTMFAAEDVSALEDV